MLFPFFLMSCSNAGLPQDQALTMITEYLEQKPATHKLYLGDDDGNLVYYYPAHYYDINHNYSKLGDKFESDPFRYVALSQKGIITYRVLKLNHYTKEDRSHSSDWFEIHLTPMAMEHVINVESHRERGKVIRSATVSLAELDRVEITGITEPYDLLGHKMADVTYRAIYRLTPFGEVFRDLVADVVEETKTFVMYSDGWRLE